MTPVSRLEISVFSNSIAFRLSNVLIFLLVATSTALAQTNSESTPLSGKQLFERQWEPGDEASKGDGLGPLFNAKSCAECHFQGALGGAGPNKNNLQLIGVHWENVGNNSTRNVSKTVSSIHRDLPLLRSMVLHRFSSVPQFATWRYKALGMKFKEAEISEETKSRFDRSLVARQPEKGGPEFYKIYSVPMVRTERNSTALFGAGLIDAIDDNTIIKLAEAQLGSDLGISGRVSTANVELNDPLMDLSDLTGLEANKKVSDIGLSKLRVGKFGWKGQTASLTEFVASACANELGLQSPNHKQATWKGVPAKVREEQGDDLSADQCRQLVQFIASLPKPAQRKNTEDSGADTDGQQIFESVGCVHCHVRHVGGAANIYSDLLLHDMGASLADPVLTSIPDELRNTDSRTMAASQQLSASPPASPYGSSNIVGSGSAQKEILQELSREWRTPPLWGVGDSGPYLHDGRAETLHDAIMWHGGEATRVVQNYEAMTMAQRKALLNFLESQTIQMGQPIAKK